MQNGKGLIPKEKIQKAKIPKAKSPKDKTPKGETRKEKIGKVKAIGPKKMIWKRQKMSLVKEERAPPSIIPRIRHGEVVGADGHDGRRSVSSIHQLAG